MKKIQNSICKCDSFSIKSDKTLYLEYCPMADDNKGEYWLSDKEEIANPYFGQQMPKCGEVKKMYE